MAGQNRLNRIKQVEAANLIARDNLFGVGDQVRVWTKIEEQDRIRLAPFEGLVIRRRGAGLTETFIVRRVTHGEGVERLFPVHAPVIDHVELLRRGKVRRARLYYLRSRVGKTKIAAADPTGSAAASAKAAPSVAAVPAPAVEASEPVAENG